MLALPSRAGSRFALRAESSVSPALRIVWFVQSIYYIVTASPAIFSRALFESITGPKIDYWLVHMVALLAIVIGIAIGVAAWRRSATTETIVLSIAAAASFATIDIVYALRGTISRIYLADAVVELTIIAAVLVCARRIARA